jgi:hypothetical protein
MVPARAINAGLSPEGFALYVLTFLRHRNRDTGTAWMDRATMLAETGLGINTLTKLINELIRAGLIVKGKRRGPRGSYVYHVPLDEPSASESRNRDSEVHESESRNRDSETESESRNRDVSESRNRDRNQGSEPRDGFEPRNKEEEEERPQADFGFAGGKQSTETPPSEPEPLTETQRKLAAIFGIGDREWTAREREACKRGMNGHGATEEELDRLARWTVAKPEAQLDDFAAFLERLPQQIARAAEWDRRRERAADAKSKSKATPPKSKATKGEPEDKAEPFPEPAFDWRTAHGIMVGDGVPIGRSDSWKFLKPNHQRRLFQKGPAALRSDGGRAYYEHWGILDLYQKELVLAREHEATHGERFILSREEQARCAGLREHLAKDPYRYRHNAAEAPSEESIPG